MCNMVSVDKDMAQQLQAHAGVYADQLSPLHCTDWPLAQRHVLEVGGHEYYEARSRASVFLCVFSAIHLSRSVPQAMACETVNSEQIGHESWPEFSSHLFFASKNSTAPGDGAGGGGKRLKLLCLLLMLSARVCMAPEEYSNSVLVNLRPICSELTVSHAMACGTLRDKCITLNT